LQKSLNLQKNKEELLFPNFNYSVSHHGDIVGIACEPICLVGFDIVSIIKPQTMTTLQYLDNFMPYFTHIEWNSIVHAGSSNDILIEFYRYIIFFLLYFYQL
jgi:4'-phosphopantetheinyl transferase